MPSQNQTGDDAFPKFPDPAKQTGGRSSKAILEYIIAVLGCTDPEIVAGSRPATSPATRRLLDRLTAHHPAGLPRPKPSEWFSYAEYRLTTAPRGTAEAVKAWGEETLLAALKNSAQADESTPRIDDFDAILDAVDDAKLDAEQKRTLERLKLASKRNWVQHHSAWEGFEQLIVPLPPLEEVFDAGRTYSIEQAARTVGVSEATIRGRIKTQRLTATKLKGAMRITGVELNRALAASEFNADPRGSTAQSD